MDRVPDRSIVLFLLLFLASCQDTRSDLEKEMYPNGTPPGVTFEPATEDSSGDVEPPNDHGKRFLHELVDSIKKSNRVVAVEHSYIYDSGDPRRHLLPERIYKTVALTESHKDSLIAALNSTNPNVSMSASACIFEPHHRLEFYDNSKRLHVLEVCFQCGQLEWDGAQTSEPQAIYDTLDTFMSSIGMQPERDWVSLGSSGP